MYHRHFLNADYLSVLSAMQHFTQARTPDTPDEFWLTEHTPVFTLGQAGKSEHLLQTTDIPLIHSDRGGQITYHGPGQAVVYLLVDLKRRGYFVKEAVQRIEYAVINLLAQHHIQAVRKPGAPGVYVADDTGAPGAKIAALGLKVRNGCTYHGVALNVAMDLSPFALINPCGYAGLPTTDMASCGAVLTVPQAHAELAQQLESQLYYHLTPTTSPQPAHD